MTSSPSKATANIGENGIARKGVKSATAETANRAVGGSGVVAIIGNGDTSGEARKLAPQHQHKGAAGGDNAAKKISSSSSIDRLSARWRQK